jgi:hypothetical protein
MEVQKWIPVKKSGFIRPLRRSGALPELFLFSPRCYSWLQYAKHRRPWELSRGAFFYAVMFIYPDLESRPGGQQRRRSYRKTATPAVIFIL